MSVLDLYNWEIFNCRLTQATNKNNKKQNPNQ